MKFHLAQLNIAKMLAPIDSPVMAEFVANLDRINKLAEDSDGFIWRLRDENNNATSIKIFENDFLLVNLSVWKNIESLFQFAYHSNHIHILRKRENWFEKMKDMHMVLWYIPIGHIPTVVEAQERLVYRRNNGDTPFAFTFKKKFTGEEADAVIPPTTGGLSAAVGVSII